VKYLTYIQRYWALAVGILVGFAIGGGLFTFVYAKGASYLTNNPEACANCHVMGNHYAAWVKSSHRAVAVCNDCHTPHAFIPKYLVKSENGFRHSLHFTTGRYPYPLRITKGSRRVTEQACRRCHERITRAIEGAHKPGQEMSCIRCHSQVGHATR
jgi:cytochrome c nitrite reductase small subunit